MYHMGIYFDLSMRDLIFMNFTVPGQKVRSILPQNLTLDVPERGDPKEASLSIVAFRVTAVRLNGLKLPMLDYCQVNCRLYVSHQETPAVYFLAMKLSSRLAVIGAKTFGIPVQFAKISVGKEEMSEAAVHAGPISDFTDAKSVAGGCRVRVSSKGVTAAVTVTSERATGSLFVTERPIGFISRRGDLMGVSAIHEPLQAFVARLDSVDAPVLGEFELIDEVESARPRSVYYVPEATMRSTLEKTESSRLGRLPDR
jgi:hypothetical protein